MSDTPRTDECAIVWTVATPREGREIVSADFARQLERECNKLRRELEEARKDTAAIAKLRALRPENMACDYWSRNMGFPVEQIEDIFEELDAAREAEKGGAF